MKKFLLCAALCGLAVQARADPPPGVKWALTFEDKFDGAALDNAKWNTVWAWGNGYNNTYPDDYFTPSNVVLENGLLRLKGHNDGDKGKKFTAAVVTSKDKFSQRYGYFEIRCKMPKGRGLWPAFWLLTQDKTPEGEKGWREIDVFEVLGHDTQTIHMNNIALGGSTPVPFKGETDYAQDFHTFGLLWNPGSLTMLIDGVARYYTVKDVPQQAMYLLINSAVGGDWPTNWQQPPDETTPFPNFLDVDTIRVWQSQPAPDALSNLPGLAKAPQILPLLDEGDFTAGDKWKFTNAVPDAAIFKSGPSSLRLEPNGKEAGATQNFKSMPPAVFTLQGIARGEGALDEAQAALQVFNADWSKQLAWITVDLPHAAQWQAWSKSIELPAGAANLALHLRARGTGKVWVDDVQTTSP